MCQTLINKNFQYCHNFEAILLIFYHIAHIIYIMLSINFFWNPLKSFHTIIAQKYPQKNRTQLDFKLFPITVKSLLHILDLFFIFTNFFISHHKFTVTRIPLILIWYRNLSNEWNTSIICNDNFWLIYIANPQNTPAGFRSSWKYYRVVGN